jgi:hypothetical protein
VISGGNRKRHLGDAYLPMPLNFNRELSYIGHSTTGSWSMHQYRIYCLNDEGRFHKVEEIRAANDAEALARARTLKHPGECEIWRGDRLVGKVAAHVE